ncbi:MAG: NADH-quinone oxidoreductase subunit L [Deltaproteobacteria bacterium]|nr:NADH-quinone oxidoreductase subunit L [Deltaproteobacteria bacterium]
MASFPLYWIPLLPFLGAAFNLLFGRKFPRRAVHLVSCGVVFGALLVSMVAVFRELYPRWVEAGHGGTLEPIVNRVYSWISVGDIDIGLNFLLDPLSAVMILVITGIGFLIHLYSTGYMSHDTDYARFFGYLNLFTGAMLVLVLGDSLPVMFVGWEGVGLCSYLLIGFWYDKSGTERYGDANATAGKKAFIVNRIGDLAFIIGMFLLFTHAGTLNFTELADKADALMTKFSPLGLGFYVTVAGAAGLMLFIGATGKSAQIPLYVWLPDAMAGPTPVSALIHAATMVTAGVYMVVRLNFLYVLTPAVMATIAIVGAATALIAALIGFAQNDIKKVLAYSTVSQLGYMFLAAGVGAFSAALFHVFTHAFFKACLFLGSGAVIHALAGEQDMRRMGGLAKKLPIVRWTMLLSTLAIAGIVPFAGFFSKDEILWSVAIAQNGTLAPWLLKSLYVTGLAAALGTAFYMFRLYFMTFSGECRADAETLAKFHPPTSRMTIPLIVLAAGAVTTGFLGLPHVVAKHNIFHEWLSPVLAQGQRVLAQVGSRIEPAAAGADPLAQANHHLEWGLMGLSLLIALIGIAIATRFYKGGVRQTVRDLVAKMPAVHRLVYDKFRVDELYGWIVIKPFRVLCWIFAKVADGIIDGLVIVAGQLTLFVGRSLRGIADGSLQRYVAVMAVGLVLVFLAVSQPPDDFEIDPGETVEVGQVVRFEAEQSTRELRYRWDFDGDGKWDSPPQQPADKRTGEEDPRNFARDRAAVFRYAKAGKYAVRLEVRDVRWKSRATEERKVVVNEKKGIKSSRRQAAGPSVADRRFDNSRTDGARR